MINSNTHFTEQNTYFKVLYFGTVYRGSQEGIVPDGVKITNFQSASTTMSFNIDLRKTAILLTPFFNHVASIGSTQTQLAQGILIVNHHTASTALTPLFQILIISK
jgi:hypothetical protein